MDNDAIVSKMKEFLALQNKLNVKLHPEWEKQGWAYPDAIFTEATEAYNHLNWEWWKQLGRVVDWAQVKLEWVDVAHFLFSEVIVQEEQEAFFAEADIAFNDYTNPGVGAINPGYLKGQIKYFVKCVLEYDNGVAPLAANVIPYFFSVIRALNMDLNDFFVLFVGKVALNELRWKNGYKKGIYIGGRDYNSTHYVKTWNGVEDNEWLSAHAASLDSDQPGFKDRLLADLETKYAEVKTALIEQDKVWREEDSRNMGLANEYFTGAANDLSRSDIVHAVLRQV
jgi:hypothetical protein